MIDIKGIKATAEAATTGPWFRMMLADQVTVGIGKMHDWMSGKCIVRWNGLASNGLSIKQNKANAKHIATANPATVIAMCDEIKRLQDLLGKADAMCSTNNALCEIRAKEIERLRADAARYQWLVAYFVSDDTEHDDAIITASVDVAGVTAVIDAAMEAKQ